MSATNIGPKPYGAPPMRRQTGHPAMMEVNQGGNSNEEVNPIKSIIKMSSSMFDMKK